MKRSPSTRIEVLGVVRAWRGERELVLGPAQQRSVLVLLAVAGGRPVPTPEIVEALWEHRQPPSAVNVVHTYLKRLRQVLEPHRPAHGPSQVLPAINGGYALRAEPDTVDLWRFRDLARQARAARLTSDHRRAAILLTDALQLWKGPPGGDLAPLWQHHRLRVVAEEHAAAVAWFAEATLGTGAVVDALPVLAQAASARPLDEPLQAHLIRLYHSVGRRADAIRVYLRSRDRLREELGLDPSPELTDAYRLLVADRRQPPAGG